MMFSIYLQERPSACLSNNLNDLENWATDLHTDSAKAAAKTIAKDMMSFYKGNEPGQIPGTLLKPYYWWQAGAMWGELVEYWAMTGDAQYNNLVSNSLLFQVGEDRNYMPANASKEEGNDDQVYWHFLYSSCTRI